MRRPVALLVRHVRASVTATTSPWAAPAFAHSESQRCIASSSASHAPPSKRRRGPTPADSTSTADLDPAEVAKFAAASGHDWWDPSGQAAPLHAMNPARVLFARRVLCEAHGLDPATPAPLTGLKLADVGCGGGLFAEALARLGAHVTGVDASHDAVCAAAAHARADPAVARRVSYRMGTAPALAAAQPARFDGVIASEVIEHVPDPVAFLTACRALLKKGSPGPVVVSTLARTPRAWAVAILGAEHLARLLPVGTHDWHKFLTAEELALAGEAAGLRLDSLAGMGPDAGSGLAAAVGLSAFGRQAGSPSWAASLAGSSAPSGGWRLTQDVGINYIGALVAVE